MLRFATLVAATALRPTPPPPLATRRGALALATLAAAAAAAPPRAACAKSDFKWGPMARMSEASGLHALHALHMAARSAHGCTPRCTHVPSLRPRCALAAHWLHLGYALAAPPPHCCTVAAHLPRLRWTGWTRGVGSPTRACCCPAACASSTWSWATGRRPPRGSASTHITRFGRTASVREASLTGASTTTGRTIGSFSMLKVPLWHGPSSAAAPPQGTPGGSGQLDTPRKRPCHWTPRQCLGCSS